MRESEFGRGYATCLLMFTFHARRLRRKDVSIYHFDPDPENRVVEMWANGATDHLYGLKVGGRLPRKDGQVAKSMAHQALECGHGYNKTDWTFDQAESWLGTAMGLLANIGNPQTIEEAVEIDRKLGLRPDRGKWGCSEYLRPWK
jgi:hypothetical protein